MDEISPLKYQLSRANSFSKSRHSEEVAELTTVEDKLDEQVQRWMSEETKSEWGEDLVILSETNSLFELVTDGASAGQIRGMFGAIKFPLKLWPVHADVILEGLLYYADRCGSLLRRGQAINDNLQVLSTIIDAMLSSANPASIAEIMKAESRRENRRCSYDTPEYWFEHAKMIKPGDKIPTIMLAQWERVTTFGNDHPDVSYDNYKKRASRKAPVL